MGDDITSRTPGSVAGVIRTMWIGVVSRQCMDAATLLHLRGGSAQAALPPARGTPFKTAARRALGARPSLTR